MQNYTAYSPFAATSLDDFAHALADLSLDNKKRSRDDLDGDLDPTTVERPCKRLKLAPVGIPGRVPHRSLLVSRIRAYDLRRKLAASLAATSPVPQAPVLGSTMQDVSFVAPGNKKRSRNELDDGLDRTMVERPFKRLKLAPVGNPGRVPHSSMLASRIRAHDLRPKLAMLGSLITASPVPQAHVLGTMQHRTLVTLDGKHRGCEELEDKLDSTMPERPPTPPTTPAPSPDIDMGTITGDDNEDLQGREEDWHDGINTCTSLSITAADTALTTPTDDPASRCSILGDATNGAIKSERGSKFSTPERVKRAHKMPRRGENRLHLPPTPVKKFRSHRSSLLR